MNVKELRLGNWVENETAGYVQVCMIDDPHVRAWADLAVESKYSFKFNSPDKDDFDADTINPIPLTPEILEKIGFELIEPEVNFVWKFSPVGGAGTVKCEYLHQLQNLYFALTGAELEINLHVKETAPLDDTK